MQKVFALVMLFGAVSMWGFAKTKGRSPLPWALFGVLFPMIAPLALDLLPGEEA